MKCAICKMGETQPGLVTVTLQRGNTVVIIKEVPAHVCQNCDEYYLDEPVAQRVYAQADDAAQRHAEVEVVQYAA
ncbi:MAG TPA: type II toxin-antitoxin system MqsA family antitoxin [Gammaproteobacteria bacterium]|nr:type II toxin-antitoxin system MqsA family antitoxin [Gammaproteobacteria bacterium]